MTVRFGLIGAGGFGREVMPYVRASVARQLQAEPADVIPYFVETWAPKRASCNGCPLVSLNDFVSLTGDLYFNVAVGDGRTRAKIASEVAGRALPITIVSQHCLMLDCNEIAEGAVFCANSMVTSNARVGKFFQCNIYSYIAHDCVIGDFVTFAPGVRCNGNVHVDDYAYIGTNAIIRQGSPDRPTHIGAGAIVGMGAVVTKDVPAGATVVGNPARPLVKK